VFFDRPEQWGALAVGLGFTPHEPVASFGDTASFRQLKRSLGAPAGPPPHFRHWLRGNYFGHRALVTSYVVSSGSSSETWTSVAVEIDPPLFLGLSIAADSGIQRFFGGQDMQLGVPHLDEALRLRALEPGRLRGLLLAQAGDASFPDRLVAAVKSRFSVTDSTVVVSMSGRVTDVQTIQNALGGAAWIADQLRIRAATLPPLPAEEQVRSRWRAFADDKRLTFDAARMHMHGTVEDAEVEMALETNGGLIKTAIGVRFPQQLAVALHAERAGVLPFLRRLFTSCITTGDERFDDTFIIRGTPPAHVEYIFANPAVRGALMGIATVTHEFTMTESQVFWLYPAVTLDTATLERHLGAALGATQALFGVARSTGPYR
jgi:hypothetical protein